MAYVGSIIAVLVVLVGVVIIAFVAPRYTLLVLLAAVFMTGPPILIALRDIRQHGDGHESSHGE